MIVQTQTSASVLSASILSEIIQPLILIFLIIGIVFFLIGFIRFLTQSDNPEKRKSAYLYMLSSGIGLFLITSSYTVLTFLGSIVNQENIFPEDEDVSRVRLEPSILYGERSESTPHPLYNPVGAPTVGSANQDEVANRVRSVIMAVDDIMFLEEVLDFEKEKLIELYEELSEIEDVDERMSKQMEIEQQQSIIDSTKLQIKIHGYRIGAAEGDENFVRSHETYAEINQEILNNWLEDMEIETDIPFSEGLESMRMHGVYVDYHNQLYKESHVITMDDTYTMISNANPETRESRCERREYQQACRFNLLENTYFEAGVLPPCVEGSYDCQ